MHPSLLRSLLFPVITLRNPFPHILRFLQTPIIALVAQEDVYPKGASVQFYKMFLDEGIRMQLSEYQVLALIEWDVIVAHESR